MVCMLIDDWVYMEVDGKVGIYGQAEFNRNLKSKLKGCHVAFLDYQSKTFSMIDQRSSYQEAMINSVFDESFMIAQERLSVNSIQVVGAKKDAIDAVYRDLSGVQIERLVPYAVAVRAFLISKDLVNRQGATVFLDDLKNQAVLTIFKEGSFNSPRKISMRDSGYLISEIKRSWQSFNVERSTREDDLDGSFNVVCNNQEWLDAFVEQGFVSKKDIVHTHVDFAVLDGLKNAKFAIHFAPAEQILRQKKRLLWTKRLWVTALSAVLIVLGVGSCLIMNIFEKEDQLRQMVLQKQETLLRAEIKNMYQEKFLNVLVQDQLIHYSKYYYDFVISVPFDWRIEEMSYQKDGNGQWYFKGDVVPRDQRVVGDGFKRQALFERAVIQEVVLHKNLGQRIMLHIDRKDG